MKKYHIGRDGTPKVCRAKGDCPLGGTHFDDLREASNVAERINEARDVADRSWSRLAQDKEELKKAREEFQAREEEYRELEDKVRMKVFYPLLTKLYGRNVLTLDKESRREHPVTKDVGPDPEKALRKIIEDAYILSEGDAESKSQKMREVNFDNPSRYGSPSFSVSNHLSVILSRGFFDRPGMYHNEKRTQVERAVSEMKREFNDTVRDIMEYNIYHGLDEHRKASDKMRFLRGKVESGEEKLAKSIRRYRGLLSKDGLESHEKREKWSLWARKELDED